MFLPVVSNLIAANTPFYRALHRAPISFEWDRSATVSEMSFDNPNRHTHVPADIDDKLDAGTDAGCELVFYQQERTCVSCASRR